jgi:hypothetical protein
MIAGGVEGVSAGTQVISYRGTDDASDRFAWQQFVGSPFSAQGQQALSYYQSLNGGSLAANPNIILGLLP